MDAYPMGGERFLLALMIQSSFQMLVFCSDCVKYIIVAGKLHFHFNFIWILSCISVRIQIISAEVLCLSALMYR